jgi:hypothetical protein
MEDYNLVEKYEWGICYYLGNEFHRLDGPAVEWENGYKGWFQNGLRHRIGGPAVEYADGYKVWY